jgi:hypothetical protein
MLAVMSHYFDSNAINADRRRLLSANVPAAIHVLLWRQDVHAEHGGLCPGRGSQDDDVLWCVRNATCPCGGIYCCCTGLVGTFKTSSFDDGAP